MSRVLWLTDEQIEQLTFWKDERGRLVHYDVVIKKEDDGSVVLEGTLSAYYTSASVLDIVDDDEAASLGLPTVITVKAT